MHVIKIAFRSLAMWALVVMRDCADLASDEPVVPTVELRFALAWLAAALPDEKAALDLSWRDAMVTNVR